MKKYYLIVILLTFNFAHADVVDDLQMCKLSSTVALAAAGDASWGRNDHHFLKFVFENYEKDPKMLEELPEQYNAFKKGYKNLTKVINMEPKIFAKAIFDQCVMLEAHNNIKDEEKPE